MKKLLLTLLICLIAGKYPAWSQIEVKAGPSETVELINVMFSLTGVPMFNNDNVWSEYKTFVKSWFGEYKNDSAIKFIIKKLMNKGLVDMTTAAEIGVNSDIVDGEFVFYGGTEWPSKTKEKFIREVNKFYFDTNFKAFWEEAKENAYPLVDATFNDVIIPKLNLGWLNKFVPVEGVKNYGLTISYLCGSYNFGVSGKGVPNPVIGIFDIEQFTNPTPYVIYKYPIVVLHEYLHPFCNPLIDKYYSELEIAGELIFPKISEQMAAAHYLSWDIVLYESLVRASTIAFMHSDDFFRQYIEYAVTEEKGKGFYWIDELSGLLLEYQDNRDLYPTLDSFMPRIVDFYTELASKDDMTYPG